MPVEYLHNHKQFADLLRIIEDETGIQAGLIEKDYWIMHTLYGLQKQGYEFELKGGTSLSKGFKSSSAFQRTSIYISNYQLTSQPKRDFTYCFKNYVSS